MVNRRHAGVVHVICASGGMVDTLDSGSSASNGVEVQIFSRVPSYFAKAS